MSKSGYKNKKGSHSSMDNSFNSKLKRAVYTEEYLEKLEKNNSNSSKNITQYEIPRRTTNRKVVKKRRNF